MVTVRDIIKASNIHYIRVINRENEQKLNTHEMTRQDVIEIAGDEEVKEIYNNDRIAKTRFTWLDLYIR